MESINHAVLTPDGRRLVVCGSSPCVSVVDLVADERALLWGHQGEVLGLACRQDGDLIATVGRDATVRIWNAREGKEVLQFGCDPAPTCCAFAGPRGPLLVGDVRGELRALALESVAPGPPILTAWRSPEDASLAFGCLHCRIWSEVPESSLGTELPCPNCGQPVKLNPFVIEADWRPVAEAWQGEDG
jgi:WD40 repeat protein